MCGSNCTDRAMKLGLRSGPGLQNRVWVFPRCTCNTNARGSVMYSKFERAVIDSRSFAEINSNRDMLVELDLVDTASRSPLLLTWCQLGTPPYFHFPLFPGCLRQGHN